MPYFLGHESSECHLAAACQAQGAFVHSPAADDWRAWRLPQGLADGRKNEKGRGNGTDQRIEGRNPHHPGTRPGDPFFAGGAFVPELKGDGSLPDGA